MRKMTATFAGLLFLFFSVHANAQQWNAFETKEQARQRHSVENYEYQQRHGTPLGGYPERLGDPAPNGTIRPGYVSPYDNLDNSNGYNGTSSYDTGLQYP